MEIANGVHQIDGMRMSNAFLLVGDRLALVDTGVPGSARAIEAYMRRLGRSPDELDLVVLTHYHVDHIGAAARLHSRRPTVVAAHEADIPYVEGKLPQPGAKGRGIWHLLYALIRPFVMAEPTCVEMSLREGQVLEVGGGTRVIHVPGHTPGSICLYLPGVWTLLVGDAVTPGGPMGLGFPSPAFTWDMAEARRSIARLSGLDVETIGFGHGLPLRHGGGAALRDLAARARGAGA